MCGFLIIYSKNNFTDQIEVKNKFKSNVDFLKDRGPDETKILKINNFLVGFTRLSINSIKNGSQPLLSKCKRYLICFNGEIVNFEDLIDQLLSKKTKLIYKSEAEVILELYLKYGKECISLLRGMFSFVIIDRQLGKIFAATDRFGIKPIYYGFIKNKKCFFITSNFSSLVKTKIIPKKINSGVLQEFVSYGQIYNNSTIIDNVYDLKNAQILKFSYNNLDIKRYWYPNFKKIKKENYNKYLDKAHNIFQSSLKYWKTSEEKLSICLSRGFDSQIIFKNLSKESKEIESFTIGLDRKKISTFNTKVIFDLKKSLDLMRSFYKKNLIILNNISSLTLFQLYNTVANKGFKVTFSGEGADEIFGGYNKYQRIMTNYFQNNNFLKSYFAIYDNTANQFSKISKIQSKNINSYIDNDLVLKKTKNLDIQDKCLFIDQMFWLPNTLKIHDNIGMNFGLEVRPPFLDHKLVDYINSLPPNLKFNLHKKKILESDIALKLLKLKIVRQKFGTPAFIEQIIYNKKELKDFLESFRYGMLNKYFKFNVFKKEIDKHKNNKSDVSVFFWRLFMLNELLSN